MDTCTWLVQIFAMTDVSARTVAVARLEGADSAAVGPLTTERGSFLAVEASDIDQARIVHEQVMMADHHAWLIHAIEIERELPTGRLKSFEAVGIVMGCAAWTAKAA